MKKFLAGITSSTIFLIAVVFCLTTTPKQSFGAGIIGAEPAHTPTEVEFEFRFEDVSVWNSNDDNPFLLILSPDLETITVEISSMFNESSKLFSVSPEQLTAILRYNNAQDIVDLIGKTFTYRTTYAEADPIGCAFDAHLKEAVESLAQE